MDRRKLGKRSLHSNLSSAFNKASMTSLKRINSVNSLSSQTSNSSSKRQIDDDSNDDSASTSSRASKRRKNSESDDEQNQQNNVRATRGNFQSTGDETDDSLGPAPKNKISLSKSNGSETKKRNPEPAKKKVPTPQKPSSQAETSHRNFNATRRELTLEPDSSEDDDLFGDEAPPKRQKTTETVDQVAVETSQISLRDNDTFKKPQTKSKPTSSSQSQSMSQSRPGPKCRTQSQSLSQSQSQSRPGPKSHSQAIREAAQRKEKWRKSQQMANRENAEVVTAAPEVLTNFLANCGVILSADDEPHVIQKETNLIRSSMNEILSKDKSKVKEIIEAWNTYIERDANMKKALNFLEEADEEFCTVKISLLKLLLLVPLLQTDLFVSLSNKMTDAVLSLRPNESRNWVSLLLQQFRFLEEIENPASLTHHVEELLEIGPEWFQKELISYLPDILTDSQHHQIAEILAKMMKEPKNTKLTNAILNTIGNLAISKDYMESLRAAAVEKLASFGDLSEVPAIVDFITSNADSLEVCKKVLHEICNINMECVLENAQEDCDENQVLTLNALKSNIVHWKKMGDAAFQVITSKEKEATVFHFIIALIILETNSSKAKQITNLLKQNIKNGYYRPTLVKNFYTKYKEIAKTFQPCALSCASELLKTNERSIVDFATDWFRKMFYSQSGNIVRQREIIEGILFIMGNDNQTVKNALALLTKMMNKPEEMKCLQSHCNYLRLLLENVDKMNLEDVATLNDLMHGLCTSSAEAHSILNDDLTILMQKQLSSPNYSYKSRGVLSAVMSIKNFADKEETVDEAIKLFERVKSAISKCYKSQCLFYDQMGQVVAQSKNLNSKFLKTITSDFMDTFQDLFFIDAPEPTEEMKAQFCLNAEENFEGCIKLPSGMDGAIVPILFRVLQICTQKCSKNGDLGDIDGVLGSYILMPTQFSDDPRALNMKFHCINWFRELINAFVKQKYALLQKQVITRLNDLMEMQDDLFMDLATCDFKYQPPPCYFYEQPIPAFVRSEKKVGRKGKKGTANKTMNMTEEETWNKGSELYAKNPSYFRRLDTKIALLLDLEMEVVPSQASANSVMTVTVPQVCFIVNELLMIFENSASESFVSELVSLMPKILTKLVDLIHGLRETDERIDREAVKLLLRLLTMIFSWKPFRTAKYNNLLRDALRKLACLKVEQQNNRSLKSCEELAKAAYRNIEAEMDVATQISLAVAFVELCQTLMSHSTSFTKVNKANQAKIAHNYLIMDWSDDKHSGSTYRTALTQLLKNWIDNEGDLLQELHRLVKNLPTEVANLKKTSDSLASMPSVTKSNLPLLCKKIYEGVVKSVSGFFNKKMSDRESISKWRTTVTILITMIEVCQKNNTRQYLLLFVRYVPQVIRMFLAKGMSILDLNLKYQREDVQIIVQSFQKCVKYMHIICSWGSEKKDTAITKLAPQEKQLSEQFMFRVKGMCVYNKVSKAFYMANLNNKNLQGQVISSQTTDNDSAETTEVEDTEVDGSEVDSVIADPDEEEDEVDVEEEEEEEETMEED